MDETMWYQRKARQRFNPIKTSNKVYFLNKTSAMFIEYDKDVRKLQSKESAALKLNEHFMAAQGCP